MSTLPSFSFLSPHLKFEHKKRPPRTCCWNIAGGGVHHLGNAFQFKTAINPQKERKKRREKSVGFGVHQ